MQQLIIYIHGFSSSGHGTKALLFKEHFKEHLFLNPSLSYAPQLAISTLENIIETFQNTYEIILMGSSLGGYYTLYLSQKYQLKAILINPAVRSGETLKKYAGLNPSFFDGSKFEMTDSHLAYLHTLEVQNVSNQENILLMLQSGDEVLNYKEALEKLPDAQLLLEEGGDHGFCDIEKHFLVIDQFLDLKVTTL